jgi:hypothetical protein
VKLALQIIGTVLIVFAIIIVFLVGIAVAGSSHNIAETTRESYLMYPKIALVIGATIVFSIWFPWKKYFR